MHCEMYSLFYITRYARQYNTTDPYSKDNIIYGLPFICYAISNYIHLSLPIPFNENLVVKINLSQLHPPIALE